VTVSENKKLPNQKNIEDLFVNNADLQTIEAYLNRFNPIRVMRMERMEIRHSAILAWLLAPQESHGMGDKFLRAFLGEALRGQSEKGYPNALDIAQSDLRDVIVRREWQNIDLFLHSAKNGWAFVVENKFDSQQHEGQLAKYIAKVRSIFSKDKASLKVRGVFLTLYDEEPQDAGYSPVGYDAICEILPRLIRQNAHLLTDEVAAFLKHYLEILEEALDVSDKQNQMEKLARRLYREHSKVLKFVMEYGETTNFEYAISSLVGDDPDYGRPVQISDQHFHFDWVSQDQASFLPASWYQGFGGQSYHWDGCDNWWLGYPLIAWFHLLQHNEGTTGQVRLYAEVGPLSNYEFRSGLIRAIESVAEDAGSARIKFQRGAADEGKKYSKFLKDNTHHVQDIQDADEIALAVKNLLARFADEFEMIGKILPPFQKYGAE